MKIYSTFPIKYIPRGWCRHSCYKLLIYFGIIGAFILFQFYIRYDKSTDMVIKDINQSKILNKSKNNQTLQKPKSLQNQQKLYHRYQLNTIDNNFTASPDKHSNYRLDYSDIQHASPLALHNTSDKKIDLIMVWNRFFLKDFLYEPVEDSDRFMYDQNESIHRPAYCATKYPHCRITSHREYFKQSDMVLFHFTNLNLNDIPNVRFPNQTWLLFTHESPVNTPKMPDTVEVLFNGTINYHSESDIIIPYGEVERSSNPYYNIDVAKKYLPIVWFVSHCKVPSRRDEYATELQKYISVDLVGKCSKTHQCSKKYLEGCQKKIFANYYFYLSFENSFCDEYVTEKLFFALKKDIVPVVYGGANYTKVLPPKSFIDATKYRPKDLAVFLKSLMSNKTAYMEYFEWKRHYIIQADRHANDHMFCESCRYIAAMKRGEVPRKVISLKEITKWRSNRCWSEEKLDDFLNFKKQ